MGVLEVRVALVEAVLQAVALERLALLAQRAGHVHAAPVRADAVLVDVVAEVDHQVQILLEHAPVRGVEAVRPGLTRREREAQRRDVRVARGRRPRASHRAGLGAGHEAVEVLARRLQASHVDVDRVRELRQRGHRSGPDHVRERGVGRHLPLDGDVARRHAAAFHERLRNQPRPERDAVRRRIARRDAERKRIAGQRRCGPRQVAAQLAVDRRAGERAGEREEPAPVDHAPVQLGEHPPWIGHGSSCSSCFGGSTRRCDRGRGRTPPRPAAWRPASGCPSARAPSGRCRPRGSAPGGPAASGRAS
jgi:hypothetical protein